MQKVTIKQSYKYCPLHYIEGLNHKLIDLSDQNLWSYSTYMMNDYGDKMFNGFWINNLDSLIEDWHDIESNAKKQKTTLQKQLQYLKDLRQIMINHKIEFVTL